jgi:hypothetical protein
MRNAAANVVPKVDSEARRAALEAAARSCDIEQLPAPSPFAQALYERWIAGELDSDQVCRELVAHHRQR